MDASVYLHDNGNLIINFQKISKGSHCRDVELVMMSNNIITVSGKRVNWAYQYEYEILQLIREDVDINNVLPEYVENYSHELKRGFWSSWLNKTPVAETHTRVKPGWVELKDTNIPFKIITSNFVIYEKP